MRGGVKEKEVDRMNERDENIIAERVRNKERYEEKGGRECKG